MKRIKLNDRILPNYTKGEEIFNMVSHIVGGVLGIFVVIYGIVISLILGGSFIAGHCLFQPAVSIYFAYLISLLNKKVSD